MKIVLERTRIIFTEYTALEKRKIEDLAATEDKAFVYQDPDDKMICFPPGLLDSVKKTFPKVHIEDKSKEYWEYNRIAPVEHNAQPRNQLQVDFINFVLDKANKKQNVAGILSPGTGKAQPNSTKIPTPNGYKLMGDLKVGDKVFGSNGKPITVTEIFPQGIKEVYELTFSDGRTARCCKEHLWETKILGIISTQMLEDIISIYKHLNVYIPSLSIENSIVFENESDTNISLIHNKKKYLKIIDIKLVEESECTCIMVDSYDHLYVTEDFIITHNTFMACYSAIKVGLKTLIIVPTSGIKTQWRDTLVNMFNVSPDKVLVINSPKEFVNTKADFVIISQASLATLNKTYDIEAIIKTNKFGIKIIDEVQMWFHNIIKIDGNSNICHNWYLTGTFGRSGDEENELYQKMFGNIPQFREKMKNPTIFNRKPGNIYGMKPHTHVTMVWGHSGLSKEEIASVSNSIRYNERSEKWSRYGISIPAYTKLVIPSDGTMTKFLKMCLKIIKKAEDSVDYGRTLILSPTVESVHVLESYVSKMFPNKKVGSIHSKQPKSTNDKIKKECDIIISTVKSCGTGFDVKGLSKLIVTEQYKSWVLTSQVRGRLRVRDDGKDTYMWDIVDADVRQLRAWANNRADVLKSESKSFKVIDMD